MPYRAFPERVGPRILSLESVDYFGTNEHFSENLDGEANFGTREYLSGRKKEECLRAIFSETSIVMLCK